MIDPGFLSPPPLNFHEASWFVLPIRWTHLAYKSPFVRLSLRWSLTLTNTNNYNRAWLTSLKPCRSRWLEQTTLLCLELCSVLPPPFFSSCTCILLSTSPSSDLFSMCGYLVISWNRIWVVHRPRIPFAPSSSVQQFPSSSSCTCILLSTSPSWDLSFPGVDLWSCSSFVAMWHPLKCLLGNAVIALSLNMSPSQVHFLRRIWYSTGSAAQFLLHSSCLYRWRPAIVYLYFSANTC